jgi:predicted RNA binding protein YcfA (HicA-like mRNA interferase family)
VSQWSSSKASRVLKALEKIGWKQKGNKGGSHRKLYHPNYPNPYTFSFHDSAEVGPAALARIAKKTGLKPEDI